MLFYSQSRGEMTDSEGAVICRNCYAGGQGGLHPAGKNNPLAQAMPNVGPLPQGQYTIGPLHTLPHLGPAMPLTPAPANQMFGRSGFFMHLDNPHHVGDSSDGCLILPSPAALQAMETLRAGGADQLTVTE